MISKFVVVQTVSINELLSNGIKSVEKYNESKADILRVNLGRISQADIPICISILKCIKKELILDIPFPGQKRRIGVFSSFGEKQLDLQIDKGQNLIITHNLQVCLKKNYPFYHLELPDLREINVTLSSIILSGDGDGAFEICEKTSDGYIIRAKNSFQIFSGQTLHFKSDNRIKKGNLNFYLNIIKEVRPGAVALSFVEDYKIVSIAKKALALMHTKVISKIETPTGISNVQQIAAVSDAVMLGRGDLGIYGAAHDLFYFQRRAITLAHNQNTPIFIATDVLTSVARRWIPSRSDLIDLACCMEMGADGIVLTAGVPVTDDLLKIIASTSKYNKQTIITD